jgi:hypothetical protein
MSITLPGSSYHVRELTHSTHNVETVLIRSLQDILLRSYNRT